jgi:hypothetical protein
VLHSQEEAHVRVAHMEQET